MPRWQNLKSPHEEKFVRGYSIYPIGGCSEFPWYFRELEGFGSDWKRDIKRYYRTPVSFYCQVPSLPSATNYVDIDPSAKDVFGIPAVRVHFKWGSNELMMWDHARQVSAEVIESSGGKVWQIGKSPNTPGYSLHETGTLRMGNDPKKFVTNKFGQTHDVSNLFVADASLFLGSSDKTTTLSILAFSLRTSEYLIDSFKSGRL